MFLLFLVLITAVGLAIRLVVDGVRRDQAVVLSAALVVPFSLVVIRPAVRVIPADPGESPADVERSNSDRSLR